MNKIYYSGFFVCLSFFGTAQSNTVSSGKDITGPGGSASYSIGQIDYINQASTSGSEHQGVQQPFEFFIDDLNVEALAKIGLKVYPNPATNYIIINSTNKNGKLRCTINDASGKIISTHNLNSDSEKLNLAYIAPGTYQVNIYQDNEKIESIKIVKH